MSKPNSTKHEDEDESFSSSAAPKAFVDHIQRYGFQDRQLSDITLTYKDKDYFLHKLVLSQSHYFRALLSGPWKERKECRVDLPFENPNVTPQVFEAVISYLYGYNIWPGLALENLGSVYALGSFLGLCSLCKDAEKFPLKDISLENFERYYALSQDINCAGRLADSLTDACTKLLYSHASRELNYFLPKLTLKMLINLLKADELWIPNESERYKLAKQSLRDWKLAKKRCSNLPKRLKTCDVTVMEDCDEVELKNLRMLWKDDSEHQEDSFQEVFDTLFTHGGIIFAHMELDEILLLKKELKNVDLPQIVADNALWQNAIFYNTKTLKPNDGDRCYHISDSDESDTIFGALRDKGNNISTGSKNEDASDLSLMISQKRSSIEQDPELRITSSGFSWVAKLDIENPMNGFPPIRFGAEYVFRGDTWINSCDRNFYLCAGYHFIFTAPKQSNGRVNVTLHVYTASGARVRMANCFSKVYVHTSSGICSSGRVRVSTLSNSYKRIAGVEDVDAVEDKPLRVSAVVQLIK